MTVFVWVCADEDTDVARSGGDRPGVELLADGAERLGGEERPHVHGLDGAVRPSPERLADDEERNGVERGVPLPRPREELGSDGRGEVAVGRRQGSVEGGERGGRPAHVGPRAGGRRDREGDNSGEVRPGERRVLRRRSRNVGPDRPDCPCPGQDEPFGEVPRRLERRRREDDAVEPPEEDGLEDLVVLVELAARGEGQPLLDASEERLGGPGEPPLRVRGLVEAETLGLPVVREVEVGDIGEVPAKGSDGRGSRRRPRGTGPEEDGDPLDGTNVVHRGLRHLGLDV